jgi:hypothetical protein
MPKTAKWVRVRLTSPPTNSGPALTDGEIVLRADSIDHRADVLVFLLADEEVFRLDRQYYRSSAWFVDRPTFAEWLRSRRATRPNQRRPWSEDEAWQLHKEIKDGLTWEQIAQRHGRSVAAVRRKAVIVEKSLAGLPLDREGT